MMFKKILSWLVIGTGAIAVASILHSLDWGPAWQRVIAQEKPVAESTISGPQTPSGTVRATRAARAEDSDPFGAVQSNPVETPPVAVQPAPGAPKGRLGGIGARVLGNPPRRGQQHDEQLPIGAVKRMVAREVIENGQVRIVYEAVIVEDPNARKKAEINAAIQTEVQKYQTIEDAEARVEVETRLSKSLGELFDLQQAEREAQLKPMEDRIKKLRETLTKRAALRDDLIKLRLTVLLQDADGLGWGSEDEFLPRPVSRDDGIRPTYSAPPVDLGEDAAFDEPLPQRGQKRDNLEVEPQEVPARRPIPKSPENDFKKD